MLRVFWFQLHWLIGITAGLVLAVVGFTGGMLSFEQPILRLLNPGIMTVQPAAAALSPDDLLARIHDAAPERQINSLSLSGQANHAAVVNFAGTGASARRGENVHVDPYTGELLGAPRGREFFLDVMRLHRWLLAGDVGKQIVGASTLALIVLSLSGLYLRWPRRLFNWRQWLTFSLARKGRALLWGMHSVIGTWVLLLYLLASFTGLYWSYEWYRSGLFSLAGVERPAQRSAGAAGGGKPVATGPVSVGDGWRYFVETVEGYSLARVQLPRQAGQPISISYLDVRPAHERAFNQIKIQPDGSGALEHVRYVDKTAGEKLMGSIMPLHSGSFFGLPGLILMMLASLIMPLFAVTGWMLYLDRRRRKMKVAQAAAEALI